MYITNDLSPLCACSTFISFLKASLVCGALAIGFYSSVLKICRQGRSVPQATLHTEAAYYKTFTFISSEVYRFIVKHSGL